MAPQQIAVSSTDAKDIGGPDSARNTMVCTTGAPAVLTVDDICEMMSWSRNTVYGLLRRPDGPPQIRVNRTIRVLTSDFMTWLADQRQIPADASCKSHDTCEKGVSNG